MVYDGSWLLSHGETNEECLKICSEMVTMDDIANDRFKIHAIVEALSDLEMS